MRQRAAEYQGVPFHNASLHSFHPTNWLLLLLLLLLWEFTGK